MPHAILRFLRYAVVGVSTLLLDLAMLYIAVNDAGVPLIVAVPCAFLIAVSVNYLFSRRYVFAGTKRNWASGYIYFTLFALCGAGVTTLLVTALVSYFGIYYLLARILVSFVVGTINYLFNLYINFRVAGT